MVKIGNRVASPPRRVKALQERVQKRAAQLQSGTHITQLAEPRRNIALLQSKRTRHRFLGPSSLFGESRRRWEKNHRRLEGRKLAKAAKKMAESGLEVSEDAHVLRDLPFREQDGSEASHESPGPSASSGSVYQLSLSLESTATGSFWEFPELPPLSEDDSAKTCLHSDLSGNLTNETSPNSELQPNETNKLAETQSPYLGTAFVGQRLLKTHETFFGNDSPLLSGASTKIFSRPLNPESYSSRPSMNRSSRDQYLSRRTRIGVPANVFWSVSSSGTSSGRRDSSIPSVSRFDDLQEASSAEAGLNSSGGHVLNLRSELDTTVIGSATSAIKELPRLHTSHGTSFSQPPVTTFQSQGDKGAFGTTHRTSEELRTQCGSVASLQNGIDRFNRRKGISRFSETPNAISSPRFALQDTPRMTHMAVIAPKIHARLALDMSTARPVVHPENRRLAVSTPIQVYRWRPAGYATSHPASGTEQVGRGGISG